MRDDGQIGRFTPMMCKGFLKTDLESGACSVATKTA